MYSYSGNVPFEERFSAIPVEIRANIYSLCSKKDVKNLALGNWWLREDVGPLFWKNIDVSWSRLEKLTPVLCKKGNSNLRLVSKLIFSGYVEEKKLADYSAYGLLLFLQSCDCNRLTSIEFTSFIPAGAIRVMGEILHNLQHLDLGTALVDLEYLPQLSSALKSLIIYGTDRCLKKKHWEGICKMEHLKILTFSNSYRNDILIDDLASVKEFNLKNIVKLDVHPMTDNLLLKIATTCVKLEDLSIMDRDNDDAATKNGVTDLGISCLAHHPALKRLTFFECPGITDQSMLFLSKLSTLENLRFTLCSSLTTNCFSFMCDMRSLKHLNIFPDHEINPTDAEFAHIQNLRSLRTLDIIGFGNLTDVSLEVIGRLPCMEQVNISCCSGFTNDGLAHLTELPNLKGLSCIDAVDSDDEDDEDNAVANKMKITLTGLAWHGFSKKNSSK